MRNPESPEEIARELARGAYSKEIRETLQKALPILTPLLTKHPGIDCRYVLVLLRRHARNVLKSPSRRELRAWRRFLGALDDLEGACFGVPPLSQVRQTMRRTQRKAELEGHRDTHFRRPEEIWEAMRSSFGRLREEVETVRSVFNLPHLPPGTAPDAGGRPSSFWADLIAQMLADHFREHTGLPQWKLIGNLLACVPPIQGVSMDPQDIRRRLVRGRREEKAPVKSRPTFLFLADALKRQYGRWGEVYAPDPPPVGEEAGEGGEH